MALRRPFLFAFLLAVALPSTGRAETGLRVAIWAEAGADGESLLALARAVAAGGHLPLTIDADDLEQGRLTAEYFDVLVLPEGQQGSIAGYDEVLAGRGLDEAIRTFVAAGGGFLGLGAGARYAAATEVWNGETTPRGLALWNGTALGPLDAFFEGLASVEVSKGPPQRVVYAGPGACAFSQVAQEDLLAWYVTGRPDSLEEQRPAAVRFTHGLGRGVLSGLLPHVDPRSTGDWAAWDDRVLASYDGEHDWGLLLAWLEWVGGGPDRRPESIVPVPATGRRVAVYTTRTAAGGAYPALLTAVARALENAGAAPLAIRDREVFWADLARARWDALVMPGGWAAGYWSQLAGYEGVIRQFVFDGGGYMGISAGAFYASDTVSWDQESYDYPLDLFLGRLDGPLPDLVPWPAHQLTPVDLDDPEIGVGRRTVWYQGEGSYTLPSPSVQPVTIVGRYAHAGPSGGAIAIVRHAYGSGRAIYPNLHFEPEEGDTRDWMFVGDHDASGPVTDPESDWDVMASMLAWILPAASAPAPVRPSAGLPVRFGADDTTREAVTELQGDDAWGELPIAVLRGDGRTTVEPGRTMHVTGFGAKTRLAVPEAVLEVEYSAGAGYQGQATVEWRSGGGPWTDSGLQPVPGLTDAVLSADLVAGGLSGVPALQDLEIRFAHDGIAGEPISFDRVWIRLAADADADGAPDAVDCDASDPGAFALPAEPTLTWLDIERLSWEDQSGLAGEGTWYDLARGLLSELRADGGFARASCERLHRSESLASGNQPPGEGEYQVVRAGNGCGVSGWGAARVIDACP